jgi:hypothetical protein
MSLWILDWLKGAMEPISRPSEAYGCCICSTLKDISGETITGLIGSGWTMKYSAPTTNDPETIKKMYEAILTCQAPMTAKDIADKVLYGDEYDDVKLDEIDKASKVSWKEVFNTAYELKDKGYFNYSKTDYLCDLYPSFKGLWHYHVLKGLPNAHG